MEWNALTITLVIIVTPFALYIVARISSAAVFRTWWEIKQEFSKHLNKKEDDNK